MGTLKLHSNGHQYGDRYTSRLWVGCYIWYSEASVPTSYYLMWHYKRLRDIILKLLISYH